MVWPFKKNKGRIDDTWLTNHRISTQYDDAFNWSNRELVKEIDRLKEEMTVWEEQKSEQERNKAQLQMTMERITEEANQSENKAKRNDIRAKLIQQNNEFQESVQLYLDAQNKWKQLSNTKWLLTNIQQKKFKDPVKLTEPPIVKVWTWIDIFDGLPELELIDEDEFKEMDQYFGINQKKSDSQKKKDDENNDEHIDPLT